MSIRAVSGVLARAGNSISKSEAEELSAAAGDRLGQAERQALTDVFSGATGLRMEDGAAAPIIDALRRPTEASYILKSAVGGAALGAVPGVVMGISTAAEPAFAVAVPMTIVTGLALGAGTGALIGWWTAD